MTRTRLATAALLIACAGLAGSATSAAAEFFGWQVANVANWDVLNVRAWPANYSEILVAYPNGTPLSLTGKCTGELDLNQIAGWPAPQQAEAVRYRWCEVWVDPLGNGNFRAAWVYGRYIKPL
jgi:hypothetical protein